MVECEKRRQPLVSLRAALFLSAAGPVLLASSSAIAACGGSGSVVNCTGTLTDGVLILSRDITTLNVNNLSGTNIAPGSADGVSMRPTISHGSSGSDGALGVSPGTGNAGGAGPSITLNFDGGTYGIVTSGGIGIAAISVGGNGGKGGDAYDLNASGARGGRAGVGGDVAINATGGWVQTSGEKAHGILGQSIGGSGGRGGTGNGVSASGGNGGAAAGGGAVTITSVVSVSTAGNDAAGIFAQSVGGNGGRGGGASGAWSDSGDGSRAAHGGIVFVDNTGSINTRGDYAYGILAQSIGGFGGKGGSGGGLVAFGGDGASAGDGGGVTVENRGTLHTGGTGAHAIIAQSIGGGGGAGGSASGAVGLGASGDIGGAGGSVTVENTGSGHILTTGNDAAGIFAQSIGGGGGAGGSAAGIGAVGGTGSKTSQGGAVHITNTQAITTHGDNAQAIFAQSIGGGGGAGGSTSGIFSFGGAGGGGGAGDRIEISSAGTLRTGGVDSTGILAQSIGGGGGNGGNALAGGAGISLAMGGSAGAGSSGGSVIINALGATQTTSNLARSEVFTGGDRAHGVQAQSIGGGGGNGGFAMSTTAPSGVVSAGLSFGGSGGGGGAGGVVDLNYHGVVATAGDNAHGLFAQSIGGGGGNGGGAISLTGGAQYSLSLALGGSGGSGGSGGVVGLDHRGAVSTGGAFSYGLFAQSIGGGGGNGGLAGAMSGVGIFSANIALGGSGGVGGAASDVTISGVRGDGDETFVSTTGVGSHGILAQSVGGGGGNGGFAVSGGISGGAFSVALGGYGGGGGIGGAVTVGNALDVFTQGALASGIMAQSVGGGGGNGGSSLAFGAGVITAAVSLGGDGALGSDGGVVGLTNDGAVVTEGDLAYGVIAQSIGGGGGNGGSSLAATLAISVEGIPAGAASVAIGGSGGTGGDGADVTLTNSGSVSTGRFAVDADDVITEAYGHGAHALTAQSIGGGGGNGGFAGAAAIAIGTGGSFAVAVGGDGAQGGDGANVDVTNTGAALVTRGKGAVGINAQSVGGGGGDAGFGLSLAASVSATQSLAVGVSLGGSGGAGGDGAEVDVDSTGDITTAGERANGIRVQSIGGGGGNGGFAISGTFTLAQSTAGAALAIGGNGGTGGTGDSVTAKSDGFITTFGDESVGMLVQSIGGGGGNGGLSVVGQFNGALDSGKMLGVSLGGNGGSGGFASSAYGENASGAKITTTGFGSHGMQIQSIGGGGGNGGFSVYGGLGFTGQATTINAGASVGGKGGSGGYAGAVDAVNDGDIRVSGETSVGIFAQSIGGGGGDAGGAVTALIGLTDVNQEDARTVNLAVAIGGDGGTGNHGGAVSATNTGTIETGAATLGDDDEIIRSGGMGYGIFAQSIGGGGGIGGRSNAVNVVAGQACTLPLVCTAPESQGRNVALTATIGGEGGAAGDGNEVRVINDGAVTTWGHVADGIYAQSVGGGGGNGGNGILGTKEISPVPVEWLFRPTSATKLYKKIEVAVGGNGGSSGQGGLVVVENTNRVTTFGDFSNGIFAQSVGGGGGVGGIGTMGLTGVLGLGGVGGSAGDGGVVSVSSTNGSTIETYGIASYGILAQSVGGGGGIAGNVHRAFAQGTETPFGTLKNAGAGLALGRSGGAGGDGGAVTVQLAGNVVTRGEGATGIFAQSVGGGGGLLGDLGNDLPILHLFSRQIGSAGDAGSAGAVIVDVDGGVFTGGQSATGIFAQSAGGTGTGEDVTVTVKGAVETAANIADMPETEGAVAGLGSIGVFGQSVGKGGSGDITIEIVGEDSYVKGGYSATLDDGSVYTGVGVLFLDGGNNTLTNYGSIGTADGVHDGYAVYAAGSDIDNGFGGGNEVVRNFGAVFGSFDLGNGANSFTNEIDGFLATGATASVGSGNYLTNLGTISPGAAGEVMTTEVTGNFVQMAMGIYALDLDLEKSGQAGEADLLNISGDVDFAGTVDLNLLNIARVQPGENQVTIIRSGTSYYGWNPTLDAITSAVASFELEETARELVLRYAVNFNPNGLNGNQSSAGDHINAIQLADGGEELYPLIEALFSIPDTATYVAALDRLHGEPYLLAETGLLLANNRLHEAMLSCRQKDGGYRFSDEGQCAWLSAAHFQTSRDADFDSLGVRQEDSGFAGGVQTRIADNLFAGFALSYDQVSTRVGSEALAIGNRYQAGVVVKGAVGGTTLSVAATAGRSIADTTRSAAIGPDASYLLEGQQTLDILSAHARLAHAFANDNGYIKPMVGVGLSHVMQRGFVEDGGPVALDVRDGSNTYVTFSPAVEIGADIVLNERGVLRPFGRFGATGILSGAEAALNASFIAAPDESGTFRSTTHLDPWSYTMTVGVDLLNEGGATLRVAGDARLGARAQSYGGSLKLSGGF